MNVCQKCIATVGMVVISNLSYAQPFNFSLELKPSPSSQVIIPNLRANVTQNSVEFILPVGGGGDQSYTTAIHLSANLQDGTYTAVPFSASERRELNERLRDHKQYLRDLSRQTSFVNIAAAPGEGEECDPYEGAAVLYEIISDDIVGIDLARSRLTSIWYSNDCDAYLFDRDTKAWAANPTEMFGQEWTHWYVGNESSTWSPFFLPLNWVTSTFSADYYNWDFMIDTYQTRADHSIYLDMFPNRTYSVTPVVSHSGEFSTFIDVDIIEQYSVF